MKYNRKLYVVTYCTYKSLGSVLQAYGLKTALKSLGCESTIISNKKENLQVKKKPKSFKAIIIALFDFLIKKQIKIRYKKRMDFINSNMDIEYFEDYSDLEIYNKVEDDIIFVAGSDQIWNPVNCNLLFFLDFVTDHKCISYAASMGNTYIPDSKQDFYKNNLKHFDCISVREKDVKELLMEFTENNISVNIDPVFLVDRTVWKSIERPYKGVKDRYILLYMLYWDDSIKKKVKKLKDKTGLPVYAISSGLSRAYADKHLYDVGVEEFLWLIDNADYVITSSFHGVALSTIFNKKFAPIINPKLPSRISSLLNTLSIPKVDSDKLNESKSFDYELINRKIKEEKDRGLRYLEMAIKV